MDLRNLPQVNVLVLVYSFGFPEGMATTSRLTYLSRMLVENDISVRVLCLHTTERPPLIQNKITNGEFDGIHFEYTTGTTIRPDSFIQRRIKDLTGILRGVWRIITLRSQGRADCLYFWFTSQDLTIPRLLFTLLGQILRIPILIELDERPWPLKDKPAPLERLISPLYGVDGAVVISKYLSKWLEDEISLKHYSLATIEIPILVDENYSFHSPDTEALPMVLFAGSPGYTETIQFILEAMEVVWRQVPACHLVLTGQKPNDPLGTWLLQYMKSRVYGGKVTLAGFLPKQELLNKYASASALLIPLFNDIRSKARFPTKMGEYLLSGRPVVTTAVGEASRYLEDGINAFICSPGNPKEYGEKIIEAITKPDSAARIGLSGKSLANEAFVYSNYSHRFASFVASLCQGK